MSAFNILLFFKDALANAIRKEKEKWEGRGKINIIIIIVIIIQIILST